MTNNDTAVRNQINNLLGEIKSRLAILESNGWKVSSTLDVTLEKATTETHRLNGSGLELKSSDISMAE